MLNEFKKFALRGNLADIAVGIMIGAALATVVNSLVNDILMPPVGLLLGNVDFSNLFIILKEGAAPGPYASLAEAKTAGAVSLNIGVFLNVVISFVIIALAAFLFVRTVNHLRDRMDKDKPKPAEPSTRNCPYCFTAIPVKATRCPNCTSELASTKMT